MTQLKRRNFLKASFTGLAGAAMFSAFGKSIGDLGMEICQNCFFQKK